MRKVLYVSDTQARFTLGVRAQKNFGANFEHFWVANWPQVTNKMLEH
jgi:hypothetical protein